MRWGTPLSEPNPSHLRGVGQGGAGEETRGEERSRTVALLFYQWYWLQSLCPVPESPVRHKLLKCPYIRQPIWLNKDL